MKKLLYIFLAFMLIILPSISFSKANYSYAAEITEETLNEQTVTYIKQFVGYDSPAKTLVDRRAGTQGEHAAASQIISLISANGLVAKNNDSTTSGIQSFEFYNPNTGKKETSRNVIFTLKGSDSSKKVVISCNYDNYYSGYIGQNDQVITTGEKYSEGINASAASVAVLLSLSKFISADTLPFDIDFVFFGAMYADNAGANYYNQTLNKTEREQILFMFDLSRIAVGSNLYFYTSEFGSKQDAYLADKLGIKQFKNSVHGTGETANNNLGYVTGGYSDSATVFAGTGLNYVHIFAGDYETGVFSGIRELDGQANVLNTENDKYDYIVSTHKKMLLNNTKTIFLALDNLLSDENIVSSGEIKNGAINYQLINNNYSHWITFFIIMICLIIAIVIHYTISKKTVKYAIDNKITGVMIQVEDDKKEDE